ncbi:MAG: hypothetical protein ACREIA_04575 [Opitutaceae bacterium]
MDDSNLLHAYVPIEIREQVIDLRVESYFLQFKIEHQAASNPEAERMASETVRSIWEHTDLKTRALIGEADWTRLTSPPVEDVATTFDSGFLSSLTTRLSYSSSPLTDETKNLLAALFIDQAARAQNQRVHRLIYDPSFLESARSVLNAEQLEGLRQLQEEDQARQLRNKLPKSSELPRTLRRAAREAR